MGNGDWVEAPSVPGVGMMVEGQMRTMSPGRAGAISGWWTAEIRAAIWHVCERHVLQAGGRRELEVTVWRCPMEVSTERKEKKRWKYLSRFPFDRLALLEQFPHVWEVKRKDIDRRGEGCTKRD